MVRASASVLIVMIVIAGISRADEAAPGVAILQQLRGFQELGSVLHIAAHPDDENTQLITYLARSPRSHGLSVRDAGRRRAERARAGVWR